MKFLDRVKINLKAGDGGNGACSFHRAKFIEFGGPDGGDGGNGGNIYIQAVNNVNTLIDYRYSQHFKAQHGENGSGANCYGKYGEDLVLKVPVGTCVIDEDGNEIVDLAVVDQKVLLAQGGRGGCGNNKFKTSVNQAPRRADPGEPGQELSVWLQLKLIADIGLLGLPNAGKSSLINVLTCAKSKVGAYPFTTLYPKLGVIQRDYRELVIADIPGIIKGAHVGIGLGDKFLAHVERCRLLLHLIDISSENLVRDYQDIRTELHKYSPELAQKESIVVLNKADLAEDLATEIRDEFCSNVGVDAMLMSTTHNIGIDALLDKLWSMAVSTHEEV